MKDPASAPRMCPESSIPSRTTGPGASSSTGDINQLVQELARYELLRLHLEEPPLEEVFMHYYEGGKPMNILSRELRSNLRGLLVWALTLALLNLLLIAVYPSMAATRKRWTN